YRRSDFSHESSEGSFRERLNRAAQFSNRLDPHQPLAPDMVEPHGGLHVAQAILGDLAITPFGHQPVYVQAGHALVFGRLDAEGFAVEVEVEFARRAVAPADAIEGKLFGQVTMR